MKQEYKMMVGELKDMEDALFEHQGKLHELLASYDQKLKETENAWTNMMHCKNVRPKCGVRVQSKVPF